MYNIPIYGIVVKPKYLYICVQIFTCMYVLHLSRFGFYLEY